MEQNRDPKNKSMHIQWIGLQKEATAIHMKDLDEVPDSWLLHSLSPSLSLPVSVILPFLQIKQILRKWFYKGMQGESLTLTWQRFFGYDCKSIGIKANIDKWGYIKLKSFFTIGSNQQIEKTLCRLSKNISKCYI